MNRWGYLTKLKIGSENEKKNIYACRLLQSTDTHLLQSHGEAMATITAFTIQILFYCDEFEYSLRWLICLSCSLALRYA